MTMCDRPWIAGATLLVALGCGSSRTTARQQAPAGELAPPGSVDAHRAPSESAGEERVETPVGDAAAEAPPAPGGAPPAAREIVERHNQARARHCAPPLVWSEPVAAVAQAWADQLRDAGCAFEHSRDRRYGENLFFYGPSGPTTGVAAVDEWYGEVAAYDFGAPGFSMDTGHFTQVVWRATRELGCGTVSCQGGDLWVCNYHPPGNVLTQFADNVLPTSCR
jgi:uncharacterized protein YkwD